MKLNTRKINNELERLKWTRTEYAKRIGVSKQLLHYYLNKPLRGIQVVERLAKPLGIDPRDLLT